MGGVSSVYIRPGATTPPLDHQADGGSASSVGAEGRELVQWHLSEPAPGVSVAPLGGGVLELRLPTEGSREVELGRTIQFLAEENVRLRHKNALLKSQLEDLPSVPQLVQPDICNESSEEKIARLEKTLMVEREEKWAAIAESEARRVSLVNAQAALVEETRTNQTAAAEEMRTSEAALAEQTRTSEDLLHQVKTAQGQIRKLEVIIQRLNKQDSLGETSAEKEADAVCDQGSKEEEDGGNRPNAAELLTRNNSEEFPPSDRLSEVLTDGPIEVPRDGTDLQTFRSQMQQLREARQKAISAKSQEMKNLRAALANETAARESLERKLGRLEGGESGGLPEDQLLEQVDQLKNELALRSGVQEENGQLVEKLRRLKCQVSQLNTTVLQQQNDLTEVKRKCERLVRDLKGVEEERDRSEGNVRELEDKQKWMWAEYDKEKAKIAKRAMAQKEVIAISRQMLVLREKQVIDLKEKLKDIEESIAERNRLEGTELKVEYEKQLENIKSLKELYEERVQLMEAERIKLIEKISDDAKDIEKLKEELSDLTAKYDMAAEEADSERMRSQALAADLAASTAQARTCQRELEAMNGLLTHMLLGSQDLDRMSELLQQNHALISQITTCDDCSDVAAALPKLLLDLIAQADERERNERLNALEAACVLPMRLPDPMTDSTDTISEQSEALLADTAGGVLPIVSYKNATVFKPATHTADTSELLDEPEEVASTPMDPAVQEIVANLPKVWKVLTELLSHHSPVTTPTPGQERTCYKNVDTPNGPRSVISVSNTFIRLKELILEKKSLTSELSRLKHLNAHLETRLDDQEKRLSTVQSELHKTWGVVGRMRAQHQQLHNHEKILRYELQEKRVMLSELKEELELCRDKWERARRKNNESEAECRKLRKEFAARKVRDALWGVGWEARDSGESGYSDDLSAEDPGDADRSSTSSPVDYREAALQLAEAVASDPWCTGVGITVSDTGSVVVVCAMDSDGSENLFEPPDTAGNETVTANELLTVEDVMCATNTNGPEGVFEPTDVAGNAASGLESDGQLVPEDRTTSVEMLETCEIQLVALAEATAEGLFAEEITGVLLDGATGEQASAEPCNLNASADQAGPVTVPNSTANSAQSVELSEGLQEAAGACAVLDPSVTRSPESSKSAEPTSEVTQKSPEEMTDEERVRAREARSLRLQRLEEQCQLLVRKVDITTHKSNYLSNRLEELHDHYGAERSAPGSSTAEPFKGCSGRSDKQAAVAEASATAEGSSPELGESATNVRVEVRHRPPTPPPMPGCSWRPNNQAVVISEANAAPTGISQAEIVTNASLVGRLRVPSPPPMPPGMLAVCSGCANSHPTVSSDEEPTGSVQATGCIPQDFAEKPTVPFNPIRPPTPPPMPAVSFTSSNHTEASPCNIQQTTITGPPNIALETEQRSLEIASTFFDRCLSCEFEAPSATQPESSPWLVQPPTPPPMPSTSPMSHRSLPVPSKNEPMPDSKDLLPCASSSTEAAPATTVVRDMSLATFDERMAARTARLQRLEEQCSSLFGKVSSTVVRGSELSARIQEIHEGCVAAENQNVAVADAIRRRRADEPQPSASDESPADSQNAVPEEASDSCNIPKG